MQNKVRCLAVVLSALLLSAHFFRSEHIVLMALSLGLPFFLLARKSWPVAAVQISLFFGGMEWIRTALFLAMQREAAGLPWLRMAAILGAVALITFMSAFAAGKLQRA